MAGLVRNLVKLAPEAGKAVLAAFATPLLSGLAGKFTQTVLSMLG